MNDGIEKKYQEAWPIFIIGSYRSGTSVLSRCLGQHPNLLVLPETHWIARLSAVLDELYWFGSSSKKYSHLISTGIKRKYFYRQFEDFVHGMVMEFGHNVMIRQALLRMRRNPSEERIYERASSEKNPKMRWVDATPENSHFVYGLVKLFPRAKFIHILRDPRQVAMSLMHFSTVGGRDYQEMEAYAAWLRLTKACVLAEEAFGSKKVLRVYYRDLLEQPEAFIKTCLEFVGEDFYPACLEPLKIKINSSAYEEGMDQEGRSEPDPTPSDKTTAINLYETLSNENQVNKNPYPNKAALRSLANAHKERWIQNSNKSPQSINNTGFLFNHGQ